MTPQALALLVQGFSAAITAAPSIINLVLQAKAYFATLFTSGLIDAQTQNDLMAHVDALQAAALAGTVPPSWKVEPDPAA